MILLSVSGTSAALLRALTIFIQRASQPGGQATLKTLIVTIVGLLPLPLYGAQLRPVGTEFQVNSYTTRAQNYPAVAAGRNGAFVVVWQSYQDHSAFGVFGKRYDSAGRASSTEFQVNSYTSGFQELPDVAMGMDGAFVVVWDNLLFQGVGRPGIFGQRYDSMGVRQGTEFQVNSYTTGSSGTPAVAAGANGAFVVVWSGGLQDGNQLGVFGQRYDGAGRTQGPQFQINSYTTGIQAYPAVAAGADGAFVVVWESEGRESPTNRGVFGQRYDSAGIAQGTEFPVNSYTPGMQRAPAVAATPDGAFFVAWESQGQDGSYFGVFGQRYDSMGLPQGTEFQINSYTSGFQKAPAVAAATDGSFVVVWESYFSQDGSDHGVFGQRYDSAGKAQGTEFLVNSYTTGMQHAPAVAASADGTVVVAWHSFIQGAQESQDGSSAGVFGQRFAQPRSSPTATPNLPTPTVGRCVGDCDHNGKVAVNELVRGVNIALSTASLEGCPEFDCNGNGHVSVDCLVRAVNSALRGCVPSDN